MDFKLQLNSIDYTVDLNNGIDLSIPIGNNNEPSAYGIPPSKIETYVSGGFTGNVAKGGSCNVKNISFNPHGNGTHTECIGHVSKEYQTLEKLKIPNFCVAYLTSIDITNGIIEADMLNLPHKFKHQPSALILRTLPNNELKKQQQYLGTNPPYISKECMEYINYLGIEHLLLDLPSVDKEDDSDLTAHKIFWNYPQQKFSNKTITELIYIPNELSDGQYLLNLQVSNFICDAAPSKPLLYLLR